MPETQTATQTSTTQTDGQQTPQTQEPVQPKAPETQQAPAEDNLLGEAPKTETAKDTKNGSDAVAPEIDIKVPEGVEVNQGLLDKFKPLAKDMKLDSAGAQKIVDLYVEALGENSKQVDAAWTDQKKAWYDTAAKDPEIGGKNFKENVQVARTAIQKFGGPELVAALDELGIGNHPALVRFAYRVGKAISEDSISGAGAGAPTMSDEEAALRAHYPSMFAKDQK